MNCILLHNCYPCGAVFSFGPTYKPKPAQTVSFFLLCCSISVGLLLALAETLAASLVFFFFGGISTARAIVIFSLLQFLPPHVQFLFAVVSCLHHLFLAHLVFQTLLKQTQCLALLASPGECCLLCICMLCFDSVSISVGSSSFEAQSDRTAMTDVGSPQLATGVVCACKSSLHCCYGIDSGQQFRPPAFERVPTLQASSIAPATLTTDSGLCGVRFICCL